MYYFITKLLDSYKNVLFHNKIVRFIRKLVIQYVQTLYNLYADSCGFIRIHVDFKDSHNDGAGIRGGSIVESVCCPHGDGWTVGDVLTIF